MKQSKFLIFAAIFAVGLGAFFIYKNSTNNQKNDPEKALTALSLALDWTPNTNHTGIYVAQAKGWYKDQGINLKILPYSASASADSLVIANKAEVGIGFSEGIVADAGLGTPVVSIGSIISHNTSVILARKDAGIVTPKDLDGKTFGGYGAPYEGSVMSQVIKHAGGNGTFKNITIDTDPISALETKKVDFVWVYEGWEGIQAKMQNLDVAKFAPVDYGIPDYATPNLISSPETINQKPELLKKFMMATAKGYEFARTNPDESAKLLISSSEKGTFPDEQLVYESQKYLSANYQTQGKQWGITNKEFWQMYPQFMINNNAVLDASGKPVKAIDFDKLFTNQFLTS